MEKTIEFKYTGPGYSGSWKLTCALVESSEDLKEAILYEQSIPLN